MSMALHLKTGWWPAVLLAGATLFAQEDSGKTAATVAEAPGAQALIKQLGADEFGQRQAAQARLLQLGRAAIEPLEAAMQDDDSEIRLRAGQLLVALRGRGFLGIHLEERNDEGRPHVVAVQVANPAEFKIQKAFPAGEAGIQSGDWIVAVNGRLIRGSKDLIREISLIGPARIASVLINRDGKLLRLPVLLTRNPAMISYANGFQQQVPDPPHPVDLENETGPQPLRQAKRVILLPNPLEAPARRPDGG